MSTFLEGAVYGVKQKGSGKFERLSRRGWRKTVWQPPEQSDNMNL